MHSSRMIRLLGALGHLQTFTGYHTVPVLRHRQGRICKRKRPQILHASILMCHAGVVPFSL